MLVGTVGCFGWWSAVGFFFRWCWCCSCRFLCTRSERRAHGVCPPTSVYNSGTEDADWPPYTHAYDTPRKPCIPTTRPLICCRYLSPPICPQRTSKTRVASLLVCARSLRLTRARSSSDTSVYVTRSCVCSLAAAFLLLHAPPHPPPPLHAFRADINRRCPLRQGSVSSDLEKTLIKATRPENEPSKRKHVNLLMQAAEHSFPVYMNPNVREKQRTNERTSERTSLC